MSLNQKVSETENRSPELGHAARSERIAVVHQGALGDFLLALPVFESLSRTSSPPAVIDFWSKNSHIDLIATKPFVGRRYSCEGPELAPFFHEELWRNAPVPVFFQEASATFVFAQTSGRLLAERLSARIGTPVHWIRSFPDGVRIRQPVTRFLVEQVRASGWEVQEGLAHVEPPSSERTAVREWLASKGWGDDLKPVLIHPGSGGRRKIWPLQNWWALLRYLRDRYALPVLITLGPADEPLHPFAEAAERLGVAVLRDLSLPRLSAFLAEARAYLGNDSGVTHLAAAVGTPTLAVFGPTRPEIWAPRGAHVHLIRTHWEESEILNWSPPPDREDLSDPQVLKKLVALLRVAPRNPNPPPFS